MAITTDRIDGQNIGLRLTTPNTTVNVLSVDLSTGAVTSAYLSTADKQAVRIGALDLFELVPLSERLMGATGFLQRLVSVAAADNRVVVPSSFLVGNVATLVVTVGAAPANLVVHIPYSAEGTVAWATGIAGSGGGGGVADVTASAPLSSSGGATPDISLTGTVGVSYGGTGVTTIPTNGQVLIGNGSGYTVASLTAGSNVTITPGSGSITIAATGGGGGLTYWTESENSAGVNATVPVDAFTVANAGTDVDAAIVAKGAGATLAQIPDGTAASGVKRGQYATDFQKGRANNTEVASGNFATIGGGEANTASGVHATVAGGSGNSADAAKTFVGGGVNNRATAVQSVVGGGEVNWASGIVSTIAGGSQNKASGLVSTVGAGESNTASGDYSTVAGGSTNVASGYNSGILSGYNNTASGTRSTIAGGQLNEASGQYSVISGGSAGTASGDYSTVGGGQYNDATGQQATVGGGFNNFIASFPAGATIAGGYGNQIPNGNTSYATIGGGTDNVADSFGGTIPGGWGATTRTVWGRYSFATQTTSGSQQTGQHVTRAQTTTGAVTNLTFAGSALIRPEQVNTLPDNAAYAIRCLVVARDNVGTSAAWEIAGCVKRGANAASTALVGVPTVTSIGADAGAAAWTVALVADATYGSAVVQVTDGSGSPTTVDWVCTMFTTEIAL